MRFSCLRSALSSSQWTFPWSKESKGAMYRLGMIVALLFTVTASVQAQTPPDDESNADVTAVEGDVEGQIGVEVDASEPIAAQFAVVVEPSKTLADHLDGAIGSVNNVIGTALFFDVSFGLLQYDAKDDDGNLVYEQVPEVAEDANGVRVALLDPELILLSPEDGSSPYRTSTEDDEVLRLNDAGEVAMVNGDVVLGGPKLPFLVVFLGFGAVFYTLYHGFINIRGFTHAIDVVRGKFTKPGQLGDISPFKALTSALSATVGLGNIASVAVAISLGGAGALFWMVFLGIFGMSAKFHETTLAQIFRTQNEDGTISGGPMYFISRGFAEKGGIWVPLGKVLAAIFAVFLMCAALGGGNMFQANQAFEGFFTQFVQPMVAEESVDSARLTASIGFGVLVSAMVAVVIIGGIRRIGTTTSIIVPAMAGLYITACLTIILLNISGIPEVIGNVFSEAFAMKSAAGGLLGVMMIGFQRAAFSSESGIGSSAVAHSAAKADEPVQEGFVASLEPFIDTVVICTLTALTVLVTGAAETTEGGSAITIAAFKSHPALAGWFPYILAVCIMLFAFSTMISWCYYGERAWGYLFGLKSVLAFRLIFVGFVFVGSVASLGSVIDFSDYLLLSCALPNIIGGIILAPRVKQELQTYWAKKKAGTLLTEGGPDGGADICSTAAISRRPR